MSDDPTPLSLPGTLPFPIIITRLIPSPKSGSAIQRGTKILEYSFTSDTSRRALARAAAGKDDKESGARKRERGEEEGVGENDMVGSWESPIEGDFDRWAPGVEVGMRIEKRHAARPIVYIQQPCTHPVQLHGLCGLCGKELSENDYIVPTARAPTGNLPIAGPSRFPGAYEMGHDSLGVTVSSREAKRLDDQNKTDLLHARKLSLIVDLDQTIIHTTVDPTVGEWLDEIRQSDGGDVDDVEGRDEANVWRRNPNTDALRDVATFQLEDELPPGAIPGRTRASQRWYFTKPRPGLPTFLEKMSELYEMHVYTMGTRTYADAICKAIDPDGKIFGGRILSRDESGNIKSKHLKRLFPTDQSMVVVIDDRGDVWGEIPNLVKVIPYEFFLGVGDINSAPGMKGVRTDGKIGSKSSSKATSSKTATISAATSPPTTLQTVSGWSPSPSPSAASPSLAALPSTSPTPISPSPSLSPLPLTPTSSDPPAARPIEMASAEDSMGLETLLNDDADDTLLSTVGKPMTGHKAIAGLGEINKLGLTEGGDDAVAEEAVKVAGGEEEAGEEAENTGHGSGGKGGERSTTPEMSPPPSPPLLNPRDDELERLTGILSEIHHSFYSAYDARSTSATDEDPLPMGCDVELIIPDMKSRVLEGCNIVFSGIIPQGIRPELSDIWILSLAYGARPLIEPSPQMTHCVCLQPGTEKTHRTQQLGKWVVKLDWMVQCLAVWRRVDEGPYDCYPDITKRRLKGKSEQSAKTGVGELLVSPSAAEGDEELQAQQPELAADLDDPDFAAGGWDEAAEKEFEAFLEGSEDGMSERASVASSPTSVPGTPRKRVRYADEEDLPLSSFRDAPPKRESVDEGGESPERKRKRPLLLGPPTGANGGDGEVTKLELSEKQIARMKRQVEGSEAVDRAAGGGEVDEASEAGTEGEDEFAKMLAESLDD